MRHAWSKIADLEAHQIETICFALLAIADPVDRAVAGQQLFGRPWHVLVGAVQRRMN